MKKDLFIHRLRRFSQIAAGDESFGQAEGQGEYPTFLFRQKDILLCFLLGVLCASVVNTVLLYQQPNKVTL